MANADTKIHRYKDENGQWHFTTNTVEIERKNAQPAEVKNPISVMSTHTDPRLAVAYVPPGICDADEARGMFYWDLSKGHYGTKGNVEVLQSGPEENPTYHAKNTHFAPVTVDFSVNAIQNIKSSQGANVRVTVPPHDTVPLTELSRVNNDDPWEYGYRYQWLVGELGVTHDSDCYYLPPVEPGAAYPITQSFNGSFSHQGSGSRYAVDIGMPIGTDVLAARGGMIIEQKRGFVLSGTSASFYNKANVVRILHADGTIGLYAHLQFASLNYREGMVVQAGQVIGKSGNTGFSTGPHLHFAIMANENMQANTLPFKFYIDNEAVTPKRGDWLNTVQR